MATELRSNQQVDGRLNDLYWNSGRTIDEIVSEAGVSRNTLYSSIEPLPARSICPVCADMLVFSNRTNRASGTGTCQSCGFEGEVSEPAGEDSDRDGTPSWENGSRRFGSIRGDLEEIDPRRAAMIGGAAAIGLLFGAAAVHTLRH